MSALKLLKYYSATFLLGIAITLSWPNPVYCNEQNKENRRKLIKEYVEKSKEWNLVDDTVRQNTAKIGDYDFDLSNSVIIKVKDYNSKDTVLLIRDLHRTPVVQKEIFRTLDELIKENGLDLIVVEHEHKKEIKKEDIIAKRSQLETYAKQGISSEDLEELLEWYPIRVLFKLYNDDVTLRGAEEKELYELAVYECFMLSDSIDKGLPYDLKRMEEIIINERSHVGVKKALEFLKEDNIDLCVLLFGGGHTQSIINTLEEKKISYIVIEPLSYETEFSNWIEGF